MPWGVTRRVQYTDAGRDAVALFHELNPILDRQQIASCPNRKGPEFVRHLGFSCRIGPEAELGFANEVCSIW